MSNPISNYARVGLNDLGARREIERADKPAVIAPGQTAADKAGTRAVPAMMEDELLLSETAREAAGSEAFDQARVDAIKRAISEGNYPLDSRRIAESFQALENLL